MKVPAIEFTPTERTILDLLSSEPIHIDTLAEKSDSSTSNVLVTLLSLEFKRCRAPITGKIVYPFIILAAFL